MLSARAYQEEKMNAREINTFSKVLIAFAVACLLAGVMSLYNYFRTQHLRQLALNNKEKNLRSYRDEYDNDNTTAYSDERQL